MSKLAQLAAKKAPIGGMPGTQLKKIISDAGVAKTTLNMNPSKNMEPELEVPLEVSKEQEATRVVDPIETTQKPFNFVDSGFVTIDMSLIVVHENQGRKNFDNDKIQDLAKSIKTEGLHNPIKVRESGGRFEIISGERRFRAHRFLGLDKINAEIIRKSAKEIEIMAITENLQREDLSPLEQGGMFQKLIDMGFCKDASDVVQAINVSKSVVYDYLRIFNAVPKEMHDFHIQNKTPYKTLLKTKSAGPGGSDKALMPANKGSILIEFSGEDNFIKIKGREFMTAPQREMAKKISELINGLI